MRDYGYIGWVAMLIAAGMGIGPTSYGVSEPTRCSSTSLGEITQQGGVPADRAHLGGAGGDRAGVIRHGMAARVF